MNEQVEQIVGFLREIGIGVRFTEIDRETFLPGILLEPNGMAVDPDKLLYPGDLLHEAGHLAVMTAEDRAKTGAEAGTGMGSEIGAQCWSYAAAMHLGLSPEVVFHSDGYQGSRERLIEMYSTGASGVPLLQWMELTLDAQRAAKEGQQPYPHMVRWLRA